MTGRGLFFCMAFAAMSAAAVAAETARAPGTKFRDCADCPEMVVIPAGSFMMGSPSSEAGREYVEDPQHKVTIGRAFALDTTHITRAEYARFVSETGRVSGPDCYAFDAKQVKIAKVPGPDWREPGFAQTDRDPVVCVGWDDVQAFIDWLNDKVRCAGGAPSNATGPYRLPTEAEWEYAARAGTTTRAYWGDAISHEHANYGLDKTCSAASCGPLAEGRDRWLYTSPVGSFPANSFGLYDMGGNAWQWTADCYESSYEGAPTDGSARLACSKLSNFIPPGGTSRPLRVSRGGSWLDTPRWIRSATRDRIGPDFRAGFLGFRVARTLD